MFTPGAAAQHSANNGEFFALCCAATRPVCVGGGGLCSVRNGNNCSQGGCSHSRLKQQYKQIMEISVFRDVTHHASCVDGKGGESHRIVLTVFYRDVDGAVLVRRLRVSRLRRGRHEAVRSACRLRRAVMDQMRSFQHGGKTTEFKHTFSGCLIGNAIC